MAKKLKAKLLDKKALKKKLHKREDTSNAYKSALVLLSAVALRG